MCLKKKEVRLVFEVAMILEHFTENMAERSVEAKILKVNPIQNLKF